ncbi:MAG: hypothetical protein JKX83_00450 [Pseudomonadales bacterium]|nr:hypothetical protein [Pseudomonadales bacterium]
MAGSTQTQHTEYYVDEIEYHSTKHMPEPNQNDDSISSLWVGYWLNEDHWKIGFMDYYAGSLQSTFEICWSSTPVINANFNEATPINPLLYSGSEYVGGENNQNLIRRAGSYAVAWTRFKLPDAIESANDILYFAVKDVSIAGGHAGTKYPWSRADGKDAPSANIRTINYHLRPSDS